MSVYSPYVKLKDYGLVFENKGKSAYKYTINLVTERDNLFLEKRLFFDKKKILEEIKKDADRKNTFFIRNNGVLKAYKSEVTDYMAGKIDKYDNFDVMNSIFRNKSKFAYNFFEILFHGYDGKPRQRLPCMFTIGDKSALTDLHPIAVNLNRIMIKGGVDLFITPELYAQKKSIFKRLAEVSSITVTQNELKKIRSQLNDNTLLFQNFTNLEVSLNNRTTEV